MNFSHKLRKLFDPDVICSLREHVHRAFHPINAHRFLEELRWEIARQPGRAATWRHALARQLDQLLMELDANHRQVQAGLAAVRQFLQTEFVFAQEFFPK